jgi:hypothetical protein
MKQGAPNILGWTVWLADILRFLLGEYEAVYIFVYKEKVCNTNAKNIWVKL